MAKNKQSSKERADMEPLDDGAESQYLSFRVNGVTYGVEIRRVLQIVKMQEITEIPQMPPAMKGFITLRGSVIPVVSTRLRFGIAEDAYNDRTCIIIVQVDEAESGLIVDAIEETVTVEPGSVSPPPDIAESPSNADASISVTRRIPISILLNFTWFMLIP